MTEPPHQPDWSAIRAAYEAGTETIAAIALRHGVRPSAISERRLRYGWRPRKPERTAKARRRKVAASAAPAETAANAPDVGRKSGAKKKVTRKVLIARVYRALATNLELMESRMSTEGPTNSADAERDMRAIGSVVQTVEKAKEIEAETASPASDGREQHGRKPRTAAEADELRRRLAERIRQIRERRGA